jgi:hypothetical protein
VLSEALESKYQLSPEEFNGLNEQIINFDNATPRNIRAYGIRYRLGKSIMSFLLENNSEEFQEWHDVDFTTKRLFAADLLNKIKDPKHLADESVYSENLAAKINVVLDMVVPY